MLQDYLIPIEEAAVVFLWMGILLLIPVCVVHYWRFGYVMPSRAGVFYSFLFYALCAICLVISAFTIFMSRVAQRQIDSISAWLQ